VIVFTQKQITDLKEHAEKAYPKECCGILLGVQEKTRRIVYEIYRARNAALQPRTHFVLPSDTILEAELRAEVKGLEIVGFYHSHPDSDSCLSEEDQAYVMPGMSYPVISVTGDRIREFSSWELRCGKDQTAIVHEKIMIGE
jgi:proteasome lid subunit RPN8/RPN11